MSVPPPGLRQKIVIPFTLLAPIHFDGSCRSRLHALYPLTEAEVRQLLRDCGGFGGLEAWIAGRRWRAVPGGWIVTGELQGWQFRLDVIPAGGLRISVSASGGDPAVWIVTAKRTDK
jgi:hypothetical protein